MVRTEEGSVLYLCTKFEADSSIRSEIIRVPKFGIRSRDHGHAYLGVVLYSVRRRGPSSISVPNLKGIAQFVQKLLGGPKFRNWSRDPCHADHIRGSLVPGFTRCSSGSWLVFPWHLQNSKQAPRWHNSDVLQSNIILFVFFAVSVVWYYSRPYTSL